MKLPLVKPKSRRTDFSKNKTLTLKNAPNLGSVSDTFTPSSSAPGQLATYNSNILMQSERMILHWLFKLFVRLRFLGSCFVEGTLGKRLDKRLHKRLDRRPECAKSGSENLIFANFRDVSRGSCRH